MSKVSFPCAAGETILDARGARGLLAALLLSKRRLLDVRRTRGAGTAGAR